MGLPYFPIPELIVLGAVIIALIPAAKEAWARCITANHANLSWQDHQDRINVWKQRMRGAILAGFSWAAPCSVAYLLTGNETWAVWAALGLTLNAMLFCLMLFPLQLHIRHQKPKAQTRQIVLAGE